MPNATPEDGANVFEGLGVVLPRNRTLAIPNGRWPPGLERRSQAVAPLPWRQIISSPYETSLSLPLQLR